MRKPPLALNPHLQLKKQRLKELLNEQAAMDLSPSFSPAGHYIDRSIPSQTDNGAYEMYRHNYPRQQYNSYDRLEARYLYEPVAFSYGPRKQSKRNRVIEMWEYLTARLLEEKDDIVMQGLN